MNTLTEKRNLADKAKEKIHRKRFISKQVEHVGTAVLQEDGKAEWRPAERGEYFVARVGKVWGDVMDRLPSGSQNPHNEEKSKAPSNHLKVVKGFSGAEIDNIAMDRGNIKEIPAQARTAGRNA